MKFEEVGLNICSPDPSEIWEQTMGMYTWRPCKPAAERSPGQQTECRCHSNSSQAAMVGWLPLGSIRSETWQQVARVTSGGNGEHQHLRDQPARRAARWHSLPFLLLKAEQSAITRATLASFPGRPWGRRDGESNRESLNHKSNPQTRYTEYIRKSASIKGNNEERSGRTYVIKQS